MQIGSLPSRFSTPFASGATTSTVTSPIPATTTTNGRASLDQGFPDITFESRLAGGLPPDGRDINGILNMLSASVQAQQAGVLPPFSADFAGNIGGYPLNAVVADGANAGLFWVSTADDNTTVPGTAGSLWRVLGAGRALSLPVGFGTPGSALYTWPTGTNNLLVRGCSPGGAGGSSAACSSGQSSAGTGGGAGAEAEFWISVANLGGTSVALSIGAGGVPVSNTDNPGGNGGNSTFGNLLTLTGGQGGGPGFAQSGSTIGGQAFGGAVQWQNNGQNLVDLVYAKPGSSAMSGFTLQGSNWPSLGANSSFGTGGTNSANGNGGSGAGFGAGGAGAGSGSAANTGGYGAGGVWIITPYS